MKENADRIQWADPEQNATSERETSKPDNLGPCFSCGIQKRHAEGRSHMHGYMCKQTQTDMRQRQNNTTETNTKRIRCSEENAHR